VYVELGARLLSQIGREYESIACEGQLGELRLRRINHIVVYVQLGIRLLPQIGREHESIGCPFEALTFVWGQQKAVVITTEVVCSDDLSSIVNLVGGRVFYRDRGEYAPAVDPAVCSVTDDLPLIVDVRGGCADGTGFTLREPQVTSANSGKKLFFVPKLPPISWATTRTDSNGTPRIADSSFF
jgi:hypothetical protein